MTKKLLVVCGAFLAMGLVGCGLLDPTADKDSVDISMNQLPASISGGGHTYVVATLDANVEITDIKGTVTKKDGSAATGVTVSNPTAPNEKKVYLKQSPNGSDEVDMPINVASDACNGEYVFTLSVTAGTATSSKSDTFSVTGGKNCDQPTPDLTSETVTLGGYKNADVGSSIDLDENKVMMSADAKKSGSGVDLVYTYSDALDKPVLMTPVYAKDSSTITAFSSWVSPNATPFHKVSATFDDITTKAQVEDLYDASKTGAGRIAVSVGDVLVAKTDKNAYVLIQIKTVSADASGTADIKYAK